MTSNLTTAAELEAVVGERTAAGEYKSIPFLDDHCDSMLVRSPLLFLGTVAADGSLRTQVVGGEPGHATIGAPTRLDLPRLGGAPLDGAPVGLLAIVPGYGETLRVNGRLRAGTDSTDSTDSSGSELSGIDVEEAFVHCAKAMIRSKLWSATPGDATPSEAEPVGDEPWAGARVDSVADPAVVAFLSASPFVTLASVDAEGRADVSPKGDPPGFVRVLDDGRIAIADRPGNLRTDTLHNLMDRPELSVLALVPGSDHVLEICGAATVTADPALVAELEVNGKMPAAAIVVEPVRVELRREPAISAAALWDPARHIEPGDLPRASRMWSDHVQLHAGLEVDDDAERLVPVDDLHEGIQQNYRDGLY